MRGGQVAMDSLVKFGQQLVAKYAEYVPPINSGNVNYVYENQILAAAQILYYFNAARRGQDGAIWVILTAMPQSGKTGVMQMMWWVISRPMVLTSLLDDIVDPENAYVITGMSSKEWKTQTCKRLEAVSNGTVNVLHNQDLQKLIEQWSKGNNLTKKARMSRRAIFAIDEAHIGQNDGSVIDQFFVMIGVSPDGDQNKIKGERSVYVVSISATPMSEIVADGLQSHKRMVQLSPRPG